MIAFFLCPVLAIRIVCRSVLVVVGGQAEKQGRSLNGVVEQLFKFSSRRIFPSLLSAKPPNGMALQVRDLKPIEPNTAALLEKP